jgi:copper oxidase (laccase) domain-containing protein
MNIIVSTSTVNDGNMSNGKSKVDDKIIANRSTFLAKNGIDIEKSTKVYIVYTGNNYCRYHEVSNQHLGKGMFYDNNINPADGLVTRDINHALFLPIADCVGVVIYDPVKNILMLSHIGRHSLEQNGGYESVKFLVDQYKCNPKKLLIWLTPAPGSDVYPLFAFNGQSIKDIIFHQLISAGIKLTNINDNPADTSTDLNYFSHSEYLKGNRPDDGRFAVVAMMKK